MGTPREGCPFVTKIQKEIYEWLKSTNDILNIGVTFLKHSLLIWYNQEVKKKRVII